MYRAINNPPSREAVPTTRARHGDSPNRGPA
jgi:hypothetical protein